MCSMTITHVRYCIIGAMAYVILQKLVLVQKDEFGENKRWWEWYLKIWPGLCTETRPQMIRWLINNTSSKHVKIATKHAIKHEQSHALRSQDLVRAFSVHSNVYVKSDDWSCKQRRTRSTWPPSVYLPQCWYADSRLLKLGLVTTKYVFGVSDKARLKPLSSATETS